MLSTKPTSASEPTIDRKAITAKLREKHQPVFDSLRIPEAVFIPKMAYRPSGKDELFVSFFASELRKECDLYTEFTNRDLEPEDMTRTLWKWNYNPHWSEEYELTSTDRYLVPVSELVTVRAASISTPVKEEFSLEDILGTDDAPMSEMTIRDLMTILTKKPVSKKAWLNDLVK